MSKNWMLLAIVLTWLGPQVTKADSSNDHRIGSELVQAAKQRIDEYHEGAERVKNVVRVVYFHPRDLEPLSEWRERVSRMLDDVRAFYRDGLSGFGVEHTGFNFERNDDGYVIHLVKGRLPLTEYSYDTGDEIVHEIREALAGTIHFDREHVLTIHGLCREDKQGRYVFSAPYYGRGSHRNGFCHAADCERLDPQLLTVTDEKIVFSEHYHPQLTQTVALFNTWYLGGIAHELGHGLGLPHDAGSPEERSTIDGFALMGSGNHHYREDLWGGKRPSYLSIDSALRLLSHPVVTLSNMGRFTSAESRIESLKFSSEGRELHLQGAVTSEIPAYAVVAYVWRPPQWPGNPQQDHRSISYPTSVNDGQFDLTMQQLPPGDARLRFVVLHCNGEAVKTDFHLVVGKDGKPDAVALNADWTLRELERAVASNDATTKERLEEVLSESHSPEVEAKLHILRDVLTPPTPIDLATTDKTSVSLSDARWESASVGWRQVARNYFDLQREGRNSLYLELDGEFCEKGLYAHSASHFVFNLNERWDSFTSTIGLRDGAHEQGSAVFIVRGDGLELYRSPILRPGQTGKVKVDLKDVKELELLAEGGEGHIHSSWAIWASPFIERE